jgi:transposase-like protein
MEGRMSLLSSATVLSLVDSMAILLSQAYQLARARLASAGSPILRLLVQRDQEATEGDLLRRELEIFRAQRESLAPHRRPDYAPAQRLAILQLRRLRGWSIKKTAERFVVHCSTIRAWIRAAEGKVQSSLLAGVLVWNRIDDAVRWAVHELRRLCPEPEFGTRSIARQVLRASIQISRSTVQRVLRESEPMRPSRRSRPAMAEPLGKKPHHLLTPKRINRVWHLDLLSLQILWFRFTVAAILEGFSPRLPRLRVYLRTPRARDMAALVRRVAKPLRSAFAGHRDLRATGGLNCRPVRWSRNPRWCCAPTSADPFTEARINSALTRGDGFGQRSVSAGPQFGRRENGLDNWLGRYSRYNPYRGGCRQFILFV